MAFAFWRAAGLALCTLRLAAAVQLAGEHDESRYAPAGTAGALLAPSGHRLMRSEVAARHAAQAEAEAEGQQPSNSSTSSNDTAVASSTTAAPAVPSSTTAAAAPASASTTSLAAGGVPSSTTAAAAPASASTTSLAAGACSWQDWSEWTACTKSCDGGTSSRQRGKNVPVGGDALACRGSSSEQVTCNPQGCPVDCSYSDWTTWSQCSRACGGGVKSRKRTILVQPMWGGKRCNDTTSEEEVCNLETCPVNCKWGGWTPYTPCSKSCGGGTQSRSRVVVTQAQGGGAACTGAAKQESACNTKGCPVNCEWSAWGGWSVCTKTCGNGTSVRGRGIAVHEANNGTKCSGDPIETITCNTDGCPVHCNWGDWLEWGACSKSCGTGSQKRKRNPRVQAQFGGRECDGLDSDQRFCNNQSCPVNCKWEDWGEWGDCSVSCGTGVRVRSRAKMLEEYGGKACAGMGVESTDCHKYKNCPVEALRAMNLSTQAPTTTTTVTLPNISGALILNVSKPDVFVKSSDVEDALVEAIAAIVQVNSSRVQVSVKVPGATAFLQEETAQAMASIESAKRRWMAANGVEHEEEAEEEGSGSEYATKTGGEVWPFSSGTPSEFGKIKIKFTIVGADDGIRETLKKVSPAAVSAAIVSSLARYQLAYSVELLSMYIPGNRGGAAPRRPVPPRIELNATAAASAANDTDANTSTTEIGVLRRLYRRVFGEGNASNATSTAAPTTTTTTTAASSTTTTTGRTVLQAVLETIFGSGGNTTTTTPVPEPKVQQVSDARRAAMVDLGLAAAGQPQETKLAQAYDGKNGAGRGVPTALAQLAAGVALAFGAGNFAL